MMTPKITSLFLLGMLMLLTVNSGAVLPIPEATSNPYCSSTGTLNLEVSAASINGYNMVGNVWDPVTDNTVDLFIGYGNIDDSQNPINFNFTWYDDELEESTTFECQDSSEMTFVAFVEGVLILKDEAASKYYSCVFIARMVSSEFTGPIPRAQMVLPGSFPNPTTFIPFYFDDTEMYIFIAIGNSVEANMYTYAVFDAEGPVITGTTAFQPQPWAVDTLGPITETSIYGIPGCFYDAAANKIKFSNEGDWEDKDSLFPIDASDIITFMPLAQMNFGLLVLNEGSMSGDFYFFSMAYYQESGQVGQTVPLSESSRKYLSQTDRISNLVVYSDNFFYWANLDFDSMPRSVTLTNNNIDTAPETFVAIALSSNKLSVLYTNRVDYYKIAGHLTEGTIEKLFTKEYAPESTSGSGDFKFGLTCICASLLRLSCYSSTLNCLLIKKGAAGCAAGRDVPQAIPV